MNQCLAEKHVTSRVEGEVGGKLSWHCLSVHVPKAPDSGASGAESVDPLTSVDNEFRFVIEVSATAMGQLTVAVRFVAGLNRTLESFWRLADVVDGDVKRTNRAWRRRLARGTTITGGDVNTSATVE